MIPDKIKIIVFKPYTSKNTTAFYGGQHPVFRYLKKKYNYRISYFIDDPNQKFDTVETNYIKRNEFQNFILRIFRKIFTPKHYWKIPNYKNLNFDNCDVIVTEGVHYLLIDYLKNLAAKIILHDSVSYDYELSSGQVKYLNKYFNKSLAVIVNGKIRDLYKKNNLEIKTIVIGHAVDTRLIIFNKITACRGRLLSIGRLSEEKGYEYIIKAIAVLIKKYQGIKLDIYGTGQLEEELKNLIKSLKLEKAIFLKGFLQYENLTPLFKNYDLFISHPVAVDRFEEPFLMANMEAMASGLPVITADCGGVPYVVKDKAVLVGQRDINQIAAAVQTFIENPSMAEKYSVEGRKYVEDNYSVEIIAEKWNQIIKTIIQRK